jgi:3-methyladenine DNA glycosylase AlkD
MRCGGQWIARESIRTGERTEAPGPLRVKTSEEMTGKSRELMKLQRDLRKAASRERAKINSWFFKTGPGQYGEGDRFLGVTVPALRRLAHEYGDLAPRDLLRLLRSPWHEERQLALFILVGQYQRGNPPTRRMIHRLYLRNTHSINNWDLVDLSAAQIVGAHLDDRHRRLLRQLARSSSLWERRIAMIATYHYIRQGDFADALAVAELLLGDRHDLIHKAVGWMLREIGKRDRRTEERFLRKHASRMPRTTLRYALERFPEPLRRRYLARG